MGDPVKKAIVVQRCSARLRTVKTKVASKSKPEPHVVTVKGRAVWIHSITRSPNFVTLSESLS